MSDQVVIAMEEEEFTHTKDEDLRKAVKKNKLEDVKQLIQHGASPLHCRWEDSYLTGTTTLELAILKRNRSMVIALLNKRGPNKRREEASEGAWKVNIEKLKDVKNCTVKDGGIENTHRHTPFADLIDNLPDVAAMVLDHCITTKGAPHEKDYEISFDCSLLENESSNANKCYRGLPCAYVCELIRQRRSGTVNGDTEFCNIADENYDAYEKHRHPLYKVMQSSDPVLLKHPVVLALLENKLKRYGWWLYYSNLFLYIFLVSILTAFILILPNPQDPNCVQQKKLEGNFSEVGNRMGLNSELPALWTLKIIALILTIIRLILELYQLYSRKLVGYFNDWINWFELAEYISIIIFLSSVDIGECFCPQSWKWELGVVSLALSWVVLIAWLQAMHWIGIYVTMLLRIIVSFARVAIFGVILVVGFGLTFYLLFYQPPQDDSMNVPSTFSSPLRAILSVISLTAGDIDMGGVFYSDSADSPSPGRQYESLAFIIWLAGAIIMSVLFNNFLVGLAVGEVSSVKEKARITTIKQRIELVLTQEEQFPEFIHKRLIQTKPIIVQPNKRSTILLTLLFIPVFAFTLCSIFLCCNNNHARYWGITCAKSLNKRQTNKYKEVPGLIRKTQLSTAAEVERGEGSLVTKQDMKRLNKQVEDKLNDRMTMMENKLNDIVTVMENKLNDRVTMMEDKLNDRVTVMEEKLNDRMTMMEDKLKERLTVMQDTLILEIKRGIYY